MILIAFLSLASPSSADVSIYISPTGDDSASGSIEAPLASLTAARDAIRAQRDADEPATIWIRGGHYHFDSTLALAAEDSGLTLRAYADEAVTFDGSRPIDTSGFAEVTDPIALARLAPSARGEVQSTLIDDDVLAEKLASNATLSLDGKMMQYARFPNRGFAHMSKLIDKGAEYAHGRTPGDPPTYAMESPIGGTLEIREEPSGDWEGEFAVNQRARVHGYLAYDWYKQSHRVAGVSSRSLKLLEYSRYGLRWVPGIPRRLIVTGFVCEVDQPGEWYFDDVSSTLFIWPFEPITDDTTLGVWSGPAFAALDGAAAVTIRDLTITGVSDPKSRAMVDIKGGEGNLIAGCTLKNSTRTAVWIDGGEDNGILSCDVYDVSAHLNLYGGDTKTLTPSRNFARNCHFTQVQATDFYGRVAVRGVGQIFQNNLVHNFIGQPITPGGNDQLIERNEIFNVGIEEGDGGAMYTAQAIWGGYGQVFRHNFLHHLMCVPEAHPRGGIYLDQLYGGSTIEGNILYKAAHRAILLNGSAGVKVRGNILINGNIGIYNTSAYGEKSFSDIPLFDSGEMKRGDVGDYVWRTEQAIGEDGWNSEPWASRFPQFRRIMNQPKMRFFPIECEVTGNLFSGNVSDTSFRTGWGAEDTVDMSQAVDYVRYADNRQVALDLFRDAENMDFGLADPKPGWAPDIPFDSIGLYVDEYRTSVPDKSAYRNAIKDRLQNRPSFDPDAKYDPATVNSLLYFNTGKLLLDPL